MMFLALLCKEGFQVCQEVLPELFVGRQPLVDCPQ